MVKFIEFWVINAYGIPLFHQKANNKIESVNKTLVSGFISAIQSMVERTSENIETIKFKDTKLIIVPFPLYNLFFIARTKQKEKNIRKGLKKLAQLFINDYKGQLIDWSGDISIFDNFTSHLISYWG